MSTEEMKTADYLFGTHTNLDDTQKEIVSNCAR